MLDIASMEFFSQVLELALWQMRLLEVILMVTHTGFLTILRFQFQFQFQFRSLRHFLTISDCMEGILLPSVVLFLLNGNCHLLYFPFPP